MRNTTKSANVRPNGRRAVFSRPCTTPPGTRCWSALTVATVAPPRGSEGHVPHHDRGPRFGPSTRRTCSGTVAPPRAVFKLVLYAFELGEPYLQRRVRRPRAGDARAD